MKKKKERTKEKRKTKTKPKATSSASMAYKLFLLGIVLGKLGFESWNMRKIDVGMISEVWEQPDTSFPWKMVQLSSSSSRTNATTLHHEICEKRLTRATANLRYYIYTDEDLPALAASTKDHINGRNRRKIMMKRFAVDIEYDQDVLRFLREYRANSTPASSELLLRQTNDPHEANLFIVPIIPGDIITWNGKPGQFYQTIFGELMQHPHFQSQKHQHVMISTVLVTFHSGDAWKVPALANWYPHLANVTIAMSFDAHETSRVLSSISNNSTTAEFLGVFQTKPVVKHDFSLGLGISSTSSFPLRSATMHKFDHSFIHIFYQIRETIFVNNSTIYRRAPLLYSTNTTTLPMRMKHDNNNIITRRRNEIGSGTLSKTTWIDYFTNSQFCLCIRGDTPHSHALMRAVRAGCIPVVICDSCPIFSPTLKSTINMTDYSIFIEEHEFMTDPVRALRGLQDLSRDYIEEKIQNLTFAQRVMFGDHPDSLFVEAFLHEAVLAASS